MNKLVLPLLRSICSADEARTVGSSSGVDIISVEYNDKGLNALSLLYRCSLMGADDGCG